MAFMFFIFGFILVCGLGNTYILSRFCSFWKLKRRWPFWLLVVLLAQSYVLSIVLEGLYYHPVTRLLYYLSAMWLGVGLITLTVLAVHDLVSLFIKPDGKRSSVIVLTAVAILSSYAFFNAITLRVVPIELPADVDLDIVQLSDIHLGSVPLGFLEKVIDKTNALNPDVVMITGDLLDPVSGLAGDDLHILDRIDAPVYMVIGNHELYAGVDETRRLLAGTKVKLLNNQLDEFGSVQIIGIPDSENPDQVRIQLKGISFDPDRYTILMYHRPVGLKDAADKGIDLMLSGHTHNGQIFPFTLLVKLQFPMIKGLHQYQETFLYVSTGTGTWGPRMRLGSISQITHLKLRTLQSRQQEPDKVVP